MSGLSGEDRAYLENVCDEEGGMPCPVCERNQRVLALIDQQEKADQAQRTAIWVLQARVDQQEKALEAADELADATDVTSDEVYLKARADAYRALRPSPVPEGEGVMGVTLREGGQGEVR